MPAEQMISSFSDAEQFAISRTEQIRVILDRKQSLIADLERLRILLDALIEKARKV
jgi:hypothetical protein